MIETRLESIMLNQYVFYSQACTAIEGWGGGEVRRRAAAAKQPRGQLISISHDQAWKIFHPGTIFGYQDM